MAETFSLWDAADHLRSKEDMRLYLEACVEEDPGDGSLIRAALKDIARSQNMSQLARDVGDDPGGAVQGLVGEGQSVFRHRHPHYPSAGDADPDHGLAIRRSR